MISDRRRLAEACRAPVDQWRPLLLAQLRGAAAGGADLIQIREPDLDAGELCALVGEVVANVRGTECGVVVNDRVDVAVAAGADGVHLRELSVKSEVIRQHFPRLLIGRSVHSVDSIRAGYGNDYFIAGTVFRTTSKPAAALLGLDGLAAIAKAAAATPVLAIGGVSADRIGELSRAGARGIAAIGAFIPSEPIDSLESAVQKLTKNLRNTFDTVGLLF